MGFAAAPRVLGIDDRGREILTDLDGEMTTEFMDRDWSEDQIASAGELLRRLRDATPPQRVRPLAVLTEPSGPLCVVPAVGTGWMLLDANTIGGYGNREARTVHSVPEGGTLRVKKPTEILKGVAMTETEPAPEQQPAHQHSYIHNNTKDDYLKRLRRIEGQARGLQRMVEEEQYCIDILTQVSAMTKALQSVAIGLLDEHMSHCVVDAAREGGHEAEIKLKEASDAIARLVRS